MLKTYFDSKEALGLTGTGGGMIRSLRKLISD